MKTGIFFTLLLIFLCIYACKKDPALPPFADNNTPTVTGNPAVLAWYTDSIYSTSIAGTPTAQLYGKVLSLTAVAVDDKEVKKYITINLYRYKGPGNYTQKDSLFANYSEIRKDTSGVFGWNSTSASLSIRIDSVAKKAYGSFEFKAHPAQGSAAKGDKSITLGAFKAVPIQ